ncbi:hypothetical protein ACJX0J_022403, partial [Zea mays]
RRDSEDNQGQHVILAEYFVVTVLNTWFLSTRLRIANISMDIIIPNEVEATNDVIVA